MKDIITFGDATLDVFLDISEATLACKVDEDDCQICFTYADKIPVEGVTKIPGAGNASNNAVGSARLGLDTAIVSILGDDDIGRTIRNYWKSENVNVQRVIMDKKRGTNYSTVLNYRGERTILVFHEKRNYIFPKTLGKSKWIYYTSMGAGSERMHTSLIKHIKKHDIKFAFQPGTHQIKLGVKKLKPLLAVSEILFLNKEEAERVLGLGTTPMTELLVAFHRLGVKTTVITDGPKGSHVYDGETHLQLGIFDAPVVERTGVGDAYATAFVAALNYGKSVAEAMRWGTANSASVVSIIGPQAGLLKKSRMLKDLKKYTTQPKQI